MPQLLVVKQPVTLSGKAKQKKQKLNKKAKRAGQNSLFCL